MKYIALFGLFFTCCLAAPPQRNKNVPAPYKSSDLQSPKQASIIQQDYVQESLGNYNFQYQTSDGIQREEHAVIKNPGTENEALVVEGSYTYIDRDGVQYTVSYIADENGFRPTGLHIPSA